MTSPETVEVGRRYYVPSIIGDLGHAIPVILPAHSDGPESGVKKVGMHFHIDRRFEFDEAGMDDSAVWMQETVEHSLKLRKFKAISNFAMSIKGPVTMIASLHEKYKDTVIKKKVCPHRNVAITNSCGTCPAHGLVWGEDGKLVYKPPFRIEFEDGSGGEYKDGKFMVDILNDITIQNDTPIKLIDSTGKEYPHAKLGCGILFVKAGSVLTLAPQLGVDRSL